MFEGRFRIVVLILATACLSMMLANILTLTFTIICMTEEKYRWKNFTIDLGLDVFEKVDFDPPKPTEEKPPETELPDIPIPDFDLPGIRIPRPGLNWQSLKLAQHNPDLFFKIFKKVLKEVAYRTAVHVGGKLDPRNIDFSKLRDGFNLTNFDPNVVIRVKDYVLRKVELAQDTWERIDAEGRNISQWRNVRVEDIELKNITWDGTIQGRVQILDRPADHYYTSAEKAMLFSIIAVGALLAIVPLSLSLHRYGCRKTFTVVGIISTVATALCPVAAATGFVPFVIARCLQGIGFAACMPVIGCVTAAWARLNENGLFNGALTSFIQLAPVITMPMSGLLCSSFLTWRAVYYLHAAITAVLIAFWWIVYRDAPSEQERVKIGELRQIQEGKVVGTRNGHNNRLAYPFRAICTTPSVWAVWIAAIGNMFAIQMLILFAPTYIRHVLNYPIINVGFAAALPTFCQFFMKMFAGIMSDKITRLDDCQKVRICNTIAFCGMAFFLIALALVPTDWHVLALLFLVLAVTVLGFNTGGFFKSATLIGRQYAYFVNANVQFIMCVAMLLVPVIVYGLTPTNSSGQWAAVFILHAIGLIVTNIVFWIFGKGVAAEFTRSHEASATRLDAGDAQTEQTRPIIREPVAA